jgi:hypothetical protein
MRRAWYIALFLVASLAGCKQGEGDRCQLDSDCEDGLRCCYDPARITKGGVCRAEGQCDLSRQDGGTDGAVDGAPDKTVTDQTPKIDEGTPDKGTPDKGPPDTQPTPDTTPTPDVTKTPDQKSVPDTFTVDQASSQDS